jgi:hypothetical protein
MSIDIKIGGMGEYSGFNYVSVLEIAKENNIELIDAKLVGGIMGIATHKCIYLDIDKIIDTIQVGGFDWDKGLFILYHEIAHYKRIKKIGDNEYLKRLTCDSVDDYCDYVINEEIFADRWATRMFYKFNNMIIPKNQTQGLWDKYIRKKYEKHIKWDHQLIRNNVEAYDKVISNYVIDVR